MRLRQDVVVALRRLARAPIFTLFSILTLTLGIGATSAIYSVIYAAVLRPPPFADADRVMNIYHSDPVRGMPGGSYVQLSFADYLDLRRSATSFSGMAAWTRFRQSVAGGGTAEVLLGEMVGGDYFNLLGIRAAIGRTIQPHDDRPAAPAVAVLSDQLWRRRFAADPGIVGDTIRIRGVQVEVIGVAPPEFRGVDMPHIAPTPVWVPLAQAERLGTPMDLADREARRLMVRARLAEGRTVAEARAEVAAIGKQLDAEFPIGTDMPRAFRAPPYVQRAWAVIPSGEIYSHESVHALAVPVVWTVMTVAALVLLIAATNLANLLLARGAEREQEIGVRLALGASRRQLIREMLVESAVIGATGLAGALVVAQWLGSSIISRPIPLSRGLTLQVVPQLEPTGLAVAVGATLLSVIVFGLLPALHSTRRDLRQILGNNDAATAVPRWRGRRVLIAMQVAVSVALVAVAALCISQIASAVTHPQLERLGRITFDFRMNGEPEARARQILDRLAAAAVAEPGISRVAVTSGLPFNPDGRAAFVGKDRSELAGTRMAPAVASVQLASVSPGVFSIARIPIVRGRAFEARDSAGATPVIIISERAARHVFQTVDVVGRQVLLRPQGTVPIVTERTIVGVAADVEAADRRRRSEFAYVPFDQEYEPQVGLLLEARSDALAATGTLKAIAAREFPDLAVVSGEAGAQLSGISDLPIRIMGSMAGGLGVLALILAMSGLYGVLAHVVSRRTREIGLRLALGGEPRDIVRLVLRDGMRPMIHGLVLGAGAGMLLRAALRPLFTRMLPAADWLLLLTVPALLAVAALCACYLPARRAARVDPNVALRHL